MQNLLWKTVFHLYSTIWNRKVYIKVLTENYLGTFQSNFLCDINWLAPFHFRLTGGSTQLSRKSRKLRLEGPVSEFRMLHVIFPWSLNKVRMWPSKLIITASPHSAPSSPRCSVSLQYHQHSTWDKIVESDHTSYSTKNNLPTICPVWEAQVLLLIHRQHLSFRFTVF